MFGVAMLCAFVALLVALWVEAGPVWAIGFVVLLLAIEGLARLVVAVIDWATS